MLFVATILVFSSVLQFGATSADQPLIDDSLRTIITSVKCAQKQCSNLMDDPTQCVDFGEEECRCNTSVPDPVIWKNPDNLKLKVHCKEDTVVNLKWNRASEVAIYFTEFYNTQTKSRNFSQISTCTYTLLEELFPNTEYTIRLWIVEDDNVTFTETIRVLTWNSTLKPSPTPSIKVKDLILTDYGYDAKISWTPNKELSCRYDMVYYNIDSTRSPEYMEILMQERLIDPYEILIEKLDFGANYTIDMMAKSPDGRNESNKTTLNFSTPSCLKSFENLTRCPPEMPQDLNVSETLSPGSSGNVMLYDVTLNWSKPNLIPDFYVAQLAQINFVMDDNSSEVQLRVPGDATSVTFQRADVGTQYHVSLKAWSKAGSSVSAVRARRIIVNPASPVMTAHKNWQISNFLMVTLVPIAALSLLLIAGVYLWRYRTNKHTTQAQCLYTSRTDVEKQETTHLQIDVVEGPDSDQWELDGTRLHIEKILGEGAFGVVRKGYYEDGDGEKFPVAIKMLKEYPSEDEVRQFNREIKTMKSVIPNPYIVSLIGCVTATRSAAESLLVVEYCSRGDLQTYLRSALDKLTTAFRSRQIISSNDSCNYSDLSNHISNVMYEVNTSELTDEFLVTNRHLISIARQVAMGMEHLARTRIVHRDLAARNVLVCQDHTVKVSDFGLSRDVYQDDVYYKAMGGILPIRWMALESLSHRIYTTQSDVWSFGVLLWEIVTLGSTPYAGIHTKDLFKLLESGTRLDRPANCSEELYEIMKGCWRPFPEDRPTFTDLHKSLEELLEKISDYTALGNGNCYQNVDSA